MITNYTDAVKNIRTELKQYLKDSGLKSLVIGISGGIDSALCAALAKPVCDELNIPLIGRSITILTNKENEINRSILTGEAFCSDFKHADLSNAFNKFFPDMLEDESSEKEDKAFKIRIGNFKARHRMMYLYDLAAKHRGMVLSTDNYTELLLGFWTLHGDVGDYGMIQNLWKTEVYKMSEHLVNAFENEKQKEALQLCIDAIPTDGLGITNSDLDQIGAGSYYEADQILISHLKNPNDEEIKKHAVIKRKLGSEYKRTNPFNIPRDKITHEKYF